MATSAEERLLRIVETLSTTVDALTTLLADERRNTMATITQLVEQVKKVTEVEAAAVALIKGLADQIESAKTDPARLDAVISDLKLSSEKLAAAVVANTPVDPSTTPEPEPAPAPAPSPTPTPAPTPAPSPAPAPND